VARDGGSPKESGSVEQLRLLLNELYSTLVATEQATRTGMPPPPVDTSAKVRAEAARLPLPLRPMLEGIAGSSSAQTTLAARSNVSAQLDAEVGDFCRKAIAGRYPFVRSSPRDVTPDDFAKLFAPGGMLETFFAKNLQQYVDTSTRPWTYRRTIDGAPPGTSASIVNFQRAQVIRDAFFAAGASRPQFRIDVKVTEMDPSITTFALDADGTTVSYVYGPQAWRSIPWPGPPGATRSACSCRRSCPAARGSASKGLGAAPAVRQGAGDARRGAREIHAALNLDGAAWCSTSPRRACATRSACRAGAFSCPSRL
jgi:type VI secretion system protein ImpL